MLKLQQIPNVFFFEIQSIKKYENGIYEKHFQIF